MSKPIFIATSDWHITDRTPISRKDEYLETILKKIKFIKDLQDELNIPILDGGDVLDSWKTMPYVLFKCFANIPNVFTTIGNHDMTYHNINEFEKSALHLLNYHHKLFVIDKRWHIFPDFALYGLPYGETEIKKEKIPANKLKVLITHEMVYHNEKPYPGIKESSNAENVLNKYKYFDIVVSGHNHQSFIYKQNKRMLINPGAIMRRTIAEKDVEPCVYVVHDNLEVEKIKIPFEKDVFIDNRQTKEEFNFNNFIENINSENKGMIDFTTNVDNYFDKNRTRKQVKEIVYKHIGA